MVIGICGKSGCGKTTLAKEIIASNSKEVIHLDIDKIGHKVILLPEVKEELIKTFGAGIVKDNTIDRKKLGRIVFDSKSEMAKLTDITWKYMQQEINNVLANSKDKIVILDWILLPITEYLNKCDIKILLDIPYQIRKERAMKRDGITEEAFDLREKASLNYDEKDFDYILKSTDKEDLEKVVKSL